MSAHTSVALEADAPLEGGTCSLFPLPHFAEFIKRPGAGLSSQRASARRCRAVCSANETIDSLNWMHGCGRATSSKASPAQKSALKHVWSSVASAPAIDTNTEYGAARELLGFGRAYGSALSSATAPYQKGEVSLPPSDRIPVDISGCLGDVARRFLICHDTWLLHDDAHLAEAHSH